MAKQIAAVASIAVGVIAALATGTHVLAQVLPLGIIARGAFVDPIDLKFKIQHPKELGPPRQEVIQVNNSQDVVVRVSRLAAGANTGWHTHPGPAVVVVNSGQLTLYSGDDPSCAARVYNAGDAFIDRGQGHAHIGRNESTVTTELVTTFFDVPPGAQPSSPVTSPGNCPF